MFKSNQYLDAVFVNASPYGSSSGALKVYIPSVMNGISMGKPKATPVALNKACFANAGDCKPAVSNKISTQNYVTAKAPYGSYSKPCYWYGTGIKVTSENDDCLSCRLVPEEEDNSTEWPKK